MAVVDPRKGSSVKVTRVTGVFELLRHSIQEQEAPPTEMGVGWGALGICPCHN